MPAHFDLGRVSHSPARFDEAQLRHWQREAVQHSSVEALAAWLGTRLDALGTSTRKLAFVSAVRGNLLFPSDAESLVRSVVDDVIVPDTEAAKAVAEAGSDFFAAALREWASTAGDFKAWARAVGTATARKGAALFMPLRAALTGTTHGPELAPLVALMGAERVAARLDAARALAG
jgi:glutamyl-tRNA synthetase